MYQSYWGLAEPPFAGPATPAALEQSAVHAEALARLAFLVDNQSRLGLVFGLAGSGKSLVLREFVRTQARGGRAAALVCAVGASAAELLFSLAEQWGAAPCEGDDAARLWRQVAARLAERSLEQTPSVLALDEADSAAPDVLSLVQRLAAIPDVRLTIVAAARAETAGRLGARLLDLADLRIDLAPWNEDETRGYLKRALADVGRIQPAFDDPAARRLFALSGGAPRKVNQLAQLALVAGAGQNLAQIDEETILAVHEELAAR
jgi:type II secretory pathway predicted ATPase ExeA